MAVLDGFPMQNHSLLSDRLIIDDPDNWASDYVVRDRVHGTAMTSLVIHGDINSNNSPINSKVYVRPILKPVRDFKDKLSECAPDDVLLIDLIHTAVRRIVVGDEHNIALSSVKIINLSFGDPSRVFINMISPLARLLDWLSYTYKILFIISAGNHNQHGIDVGVSFDEFKKLTPAIKEELVLKSLNNNSRNTRLLSPAESINNITVGALFNDFSNVVENERFILPYNQSLPSPVSAIGLGYNRSIKPDIFFNGGRKFIRELIGSTIMGWIPAPTRPPGCCVATPGQNNEINEVAYSFGTSDAAAQVSHNGVKCHSVIDEIFLTQTGEHVPDKYSALLIKAMLVHGASWSNNNIIANAMKIPENRIFRWLGNGIPDIARVMECAQNRMTLIGYGTLQKGAAHVYELPIPFNFTSERFFRKLTVTLSYFSPVIPSKQKYRSAHLWFNIENNNLVPQRVNTDHNVVQRGTMQHESFCGDKATTWNPTDSIKIKVNCRDDAETKIPEIEYALLVSFELAEEVCAKLDIDVYEIISTKIRELVPIQTINPTI
ncbi:S8 family peptidase [Paenibacillus sp. FSL H8-0548]|uniref:S8 family peptidase n=1 Tax=Paenibacillus sp. FSL H8-0548 TaxID=1920422 RepID=UPI002115F234|nr:S8 family peptidase [Paenibacillus sp. FSL H8-0548]